jgi:hypothetical protein
MTSSQSSKPIVGTMKTPIKKIISGGQTGVDRAALDWAIDAEITHGGWCPKGRLACDGALHDRYMLQETESSGYRQRTKRNVADADGTVVFNSGDLDGGTLQTVKFAQSMKKPYIVIQLDGRELQSAVQEFLFWISENQIRVLNVAGPREEKRPGIYRLVLQLLEQFN